MAASLHRHPASDRIMVNLGDGPLLMGTLGRYDYARARVGLGPHAHAATLEICYLAKGHQVYQVDDQLFTLAGGDVFVTFPGEEHSTGGFPEEKGVLYWLLLGMPATPGEPFLHYRGAPAEALHAALLELPARSFHGSQVMQHHLDAILDLHADPQAQLRDLRMHNHLVAFLLEVVRCGQLNLGRRPSPALQRLTAYVDSHLGDPLTLGELADQLGLSLSRFKARFKEELGLPPGEYIARRRVAAAKRLLDQGRSVTEVAFELGFSSSQYFATVFKRYTGTTPTAFRDDG